MINSRKIGIGIRKMENRYSRVNDKLFFADTNTELIDLPLSCFNVVTINHYNQMKSFDMYIYH